MFGCIVAGRLVQTNLQQVDESKYVFELEDCSSINHIVVFMLGTIPFNPGLGASVHFLWPNKEWQLLGMLSNEKPSAIFRLRPLMNFDFQPNQPVTLGISIENLDLLEAQMQTLNSQNAMFKLNTSVVPAVQKVIDNLYNFISSFVDPSESSSIDTFIPLSAFNDWQTKLVAKLKADPKYLDRN